MVCCQARIRGREETSDCYTIDPCLGTSLQSQPSTGCPLIHATKSHFYETPTGLEVCMIVSRASPQVSLLYVPPPPSQQPSVDDVQQWVQQNLSNLTSATRGNLRFQNRRTDSPPYMYVRNELQQPPRPLFRSPQILTANHRGRAGSCISLIVFSQASSVLGSNRSTDDWDLM